MKIVGYIRVSSEGQLDGFGIDAQRELIKRMAEAKGFEIVSICVEEAVKGDTEVVDRPALLDALAFISDGDADGVLVARVDRLARKLTTQEVILTRIWAEGGRVWSCENGGDEILKDDPDDPMRTAMRQMAGVFAQLDRAMITKRLRDGRKAKAAAGGKAVGRYPFGWGKTGPVEREQHVLAYVAALVTEGHGWGEITRRVNNRGVAWHARNGQPWTRQNLAAVYRRAQAEAVEAIV